MGKYTTELRYICETVSGLSESKGYNDVANIINGARPVIFDFDYTLFDNDHKAELESKILLHYYTQEIGFETYGLWHLNFKRKFLELLPYYNELYKTASLEFNPLDDVNYTKTHQGSDTENGTSNSTDNSEGSSTRAIDSTDNSESDSTRTTSDTGWTLYSDTPQGSISRIDVDGNNYLTNATKNTDTSTETYHGETDRTVNTDETNSYEDEKTSSTTTTNAGTNQYTEVMHGKVGTYSYAKLIKEYRDNILNIDLMFVNEFQDLFMQLW